MSVKRQETQYLASIRINKLVTMDLPQHKLFPRKTDLALATKKIISTSLSLHGHGRQTDHNWDQAFQASYEDLPERFLWKYRFHTVELKILKRCILWSKRDTVNSL